MIFRFDPDVIEQRKKSILNFLYYCAENPVLYRSAHFVRFFEDSLLSSPKEEETGHSFESTSVLSLNSFDDEEVIEEKAGEEETIKICNNTFEEFTNDMDYLYDAALCFSKAVHDEANLRYQNAFDFYKKGIDKLLTGAKNDSNEKRKRIAKTKAQKYLEKAEQLYENHILHLEQNDGYFIEDANEDLSELESISSLERNCSNLSKYKVIKINQRIMQVQDCTDKKIYVMKVIWKSHTNRVLFIPQKIPYMISLISYFNTENAIFLLLPFLSGGLLWHYLLKYSSSSLQHQSLEELFIDPPKEITGNVVNTETQNIDVQEGSDALESIEETMEDKMQQQILIPPFDTLSPDIDINDLVKVSQRLLQSVTKTLEKSVIISSDAASSNFEEEAQINEIECDPPDVGMNQGEEEEERKISSVDHIKENSIKEQESAINISSPLPEMMIKQWAAELIIAVNSLHNSGIILGDLNLNNILLAKNGHIALTFFHRFEKNSFQQLCFLNSEAIKHFYVAFDFPLTKSSDYYSVGVIIYELITRRRFYLNHPGGISKYNEIQYPDLVYVSEKAKDLLHCLIIKSAEERPCFDDIKQHAFFDAVNFNEIEKHGLN